MKIQITDGSTTITVENNESLDSKKSRRLLDVLFALEPVRRVNVVPVKVELSSINDMDCPVDPEEFSQWLNNGAPTNTVTKLSNFVGFDLTQATNMNRLIKQAPQFASKLGFGRYMIAANWLCNQGWMHFLPSEVSLRTYYNRGVKYS